MKVETNDASIYDIGRIINMPSQIVSKELHSKAYGDNKWKQLPMSGRLVIDPMVYLQREVKLNSYALKEVSEHFLAQKLGKTSR